MRKKRIYLYSVTALLILAVFFALYTRLILATDVQPIDFVNVAGYRTTEDGIYVYIRNAGSVSDIPVVQIGSEICNNVEIKENIEYKTVILLDNSQSISSRWQKEAVSLMSGIVDGHVDGESIKLASFADGLNIWSDYTTDYSILSNLIQNITFKNQDSYLTDILYDLIGKEDSSGESCFVRFILITDGADDNEVTYTQEELNEAIRSSGISLSAVGVNTGKNSAELERLFSYVRLTNGNYLMVNKGDAPDEFLQMLQQDRNMLCFKIVPDRSMQDGSTKETKFTINTEQGEVVLKTSLEMPFADPATAPVENMDVPAAKPTEVPKVTDVPKRYDADETEDVKEETVFPWIYVIAGCAVLVVVIIAVITAIVIKRRQKKKEQDAWKYLPPMEEGKNVGAQDTDRTEAVFDHTEGENKTISLWNSGNQHRFHIMLEEIETGKKYRVEIVERIVIGKNVPADILIESDGAVSRKHCEITKRGDSYFIKDLESTNGTRCNGASVMEETMLMNGDIVEIGRGKYKVTMEG